MTATFPELGFYVLPGHVPDPRPIFQEISDGERLGLGSAWISERLNTKDVGVLTGAVIARSTRLGIASGLISNLPLRNALVVASYASTATMLSENRFALGIGRGSYALVGTAGIQRASDQLVEDYVDIIRRLWRGERVSYEGPAGRLDGATLGITLSLPPPIIMAAVGFKNCEWVGKFADGVLLNTFWSKEATCEGVRIIRQSAERAGRDPKAVQVWSILATACDVPEEVELTYIIRRLNTYLFFPREWDTTCRINKWDRGVAQRLAESLCQIDGARLRGTMGDENTSRQLDDLRRMRDLWPREWIDAATATGTAEHCVRCVLDRFDAGADGVVFHATSPANLHTLLGIWPKYRPHERLQGRLQTPGR